MVVYWLRNDLRIHDNDAFMSAVQLGSEHGCPALALFTAPDGWNRSGYAGIPRLSARRRRFWQEAWEAFEKKWSWGASRAVWGGDTTEAIRALHARAPLRAVVCSKAFAWNEVMEEAKVGEWCDGAGVQFLAVDNGDLFKSCELPFVLGDLPKTFTPFRLKVESALHVREPHSMHVCSPSQSSPSTFAQDAFSSFPWHASEDSALARLRHYIWETDRISVYKETRNGLLGVDFSSKLSPWLATGSLSCRWVWHETLRYERERGVNAGAQWLRFELLWRSFFLWNARKQGRLLFAANGWNGRGSRHPLVAPGPINAFLEWSSAQTGDAFVDAIMLELINTGFTSNRGRQNAASYLVHDMGGDWRAGAAFFEHHLLDYEPGSNWGNWAYIAGVGNDPRPSRIFNTRKQAELYDPDGTFRSVWLERRNGRA